MIRDFLTHEDGEQIDTDICVIGAGAAGIAIAREFLTSSSIRVLLVESGGFNLESATDSLSEGESVGLTHYGLTLGRSRLLGGTTRLWAGQCTPLDEIDFEARPWVPYSGWPINKASIKSVS
jgi:choline dehydrogenase-like flavoprotein